MCLHMWLLLYVKSNEILFKFQCKFSVFKFDYEGDNIRDSFDVFVRWFVVSTGMGYNRNNGLSLSHILFPRQQRQWNGSIGITVSFKLFQYNTKSRQVFGRSGVYLIEIEVIVLMRFFRPYVLLTATPDAVRSSRQGLSDIISML